MGIPWTLPVRFCTYTSKYSCKASCFAIARATVINDLTCIETNWQMKTSSCRQLMYNKVPKRLLTLPTCKMVDKKELILPTCQWGTSKNHLDWELPNQKLQSAKRKSKHAWFLRENFAWPVIRKPETKRSPQDCNAHFPALTWCRRRSIRHTIVFIAFVFPVVMELYCDEYCVFYTK